MILLFPNYIVMLPCSILKTEMCSLQLYQGNDSISEYFDLHVWNFHCMDLKVSLEIQLNHILVNYMVIIRNILFKQWIWNMLWICTDFDNIILFSIVTILSNISNGAQYLTSNFVQVPSCNEIFFAFTLNNTWSPILNSLFNFFSSASIFFLSWEIFKFFLIFITFSSISLRNFGPTMALSIGLSQLISLMHFLTYKTSNGLIFKYVLYPLI